MLYYYPIELWFLLSSLSFSHTTIKLYLCISVMCDYPTCLCNCFTVCMYQYHLLNLANNYSTIEKQVNYKPISEKQGCKGFMNNMIITTNICIILHEIWCTQSIELYSIWTEYRKILKGRAEEVCIL